MHSPMVFGVVKIIIKIMSKLTNIYIYIFGYEPKNKSDGKFYLNEIGDSETFKIQQPKYLWEWSLTPDYAVSFMSDTAPFFLYRWTQKLVLGISYRRYKN